MPPLGDRRANVRFDVVGSLWGQLEFTERAPIANISAAGVLVTSPLPAAVDSTQPVILLVDGEQVLVDARVRRVRVVGDNGAQRFELGVEFVDAPLPLVNSIERLAEPHPV